MLSNLIFSYNNPTIQWNKVGSLEWTQIYIEISFKIKIMFQISMERTDYSKIAVEKVGHLFI